MHEEIMDASMVEKAQSNAIKQGDGLLRVAFKTEQITRSKQDVCLIIGQSLKKKILFSAIVGV